MATIFSEQIDKAISFAAKAHARQLRKTDPSLPYIYHPVSVGFILMRAGFDDDVVVSGILHDVVEDSGVTGEEIKSNFSEKVAEIVLAVSENKEDPWEKRKADYIEKVANSSLGVRAVAVADKLHNVHNLIKLLRDGKDLSIFFSRDKGTTIRHYKHFCESVRAAWSHPIVDELMEAVEELDSFKN